ncbi:protein TESPA1 isoform X2 [Paralichthys olivaceus]|uniref:protein TESPA1 isoform X2 n=1 Tax=Paralichthys olivaceus TaxID=8255 RepID=UPI0037500758
MDSPSSTVRRRAWINSSRRWSTLEEPDPERPLCSLPSASITDDDVFSDGCFTGKIEDWLLGCGSEKTCQLSFESMVKANNFDDDLSLGADASVLNGGEIPCEAGPAQHPTPKQRGGRLTSSKPGLLLPSFPLGQSMASSCPSSSYTCKTTSSVSEVLNMCSEDAEETLYELGFGNDEPQAPVRIPPRFFTFPSQAQGISFRLFLDSQLRRIREEDPGLSLASRFRQVQALTAMANAFYSLYSHVSRTPLQKLVPPELSLSSPMEKLDRFRSSIRSEPRSPVERLKDTVSKMCLYTGSPRGSDSTSPQPSPRKRSSLPDVVDMVLVNTKIAESVHQAPFCCQQTHCLETNTGTEDTDKAHEPNKQAPTSDPGEDSSHTEVGLVDASSSLPVLAPNGSHTHYSISVTGWEGDGPSCCSLNAPDSCPASNVLPVQTREGSLNDGKTQYLNPPTHQSLRIFSNNVKQVNSFELEEVHSAGEEEVGQSNTTRTTNSPLSTKGQHKGEVVRGDSLQSDSSGYVDEEVSPSSDRHAR